MTDHYSDTDEPINVDEPMDDDEPIDVAVLDALHAAAANEWLMKVQKTIARVARKMEAEGRSGPQLITRDQLLAAGALDVPPSWRKSLGVERPVTGLFKEEHFQDEEDRE